MRYLLFLHATGVCLSILCSWTTTTLATTTTIDQNSHLHPEDCHDSEHWCTDQVAVKIDGGDEHADHVAETHGFKNTGQIGSLKGYYLFKKKEGGGRLKRSVHDQLQSHPSVEWSEPQVAKRRSKRDLNLNDQPSSTNHGGRSRREAPKLPWSDPLYSKQWYLHGGAVGGYDMKVLGAWNLGYAGRNVVVTILDDGVQPDHPDLKANFDARASKDINGNDDDPTPQDNGDNKHGTRCAGEVAAVAGNEWCGVGIAYESRIGGVRMLDGPVSDAVEGAALSHHQDYIDIYSASWGPEDDGRTVDGPGRLAKEAFLKGITEGRGGRGNIFIWASGNGGNFQDSCSCDGYTTSIYTLSVSSATFDNHKPWYLEECPSSLATTYSSANMNQPAIVSTDMPNSCTEQHTGTSASAPIAAGIVALTLEANRNLTWRDMQHLVVRSSDPTPLLNNDGWATNAVGRKVSNKFGYGLMNAEGMVTLAKTWKSLPPQRVCTYKYEVGRPKPLKGRFSFNLTLTVDGCNQGPAIYYLEQVQPIISVQFSKRGDLKITLISPTKTTAVLLPPRSNDVSRTGFQKWPFLSVQHWGENPNGQWTLIVENVGSEDNYGEFRDFSLTLYGTETPAQPEDPATAGAAVANGGGGSASLEQSGDRAHNETSSIRTVFHENCHTECDQTSGCYAKSSASSCVRCRNFKVMLRNRSGFKCVDKCELGFYTDSDAKRCVLCQSDCATCSGPNYCDTCPADYFLVEVDPEHPHHGRCVVKCPDEFKEDTSDKSVKKCVTVCGENCKTCEKTLCRQCNDGYFLTSDHRCVNNCGDGYFNDKSTHECAECLVHYCKTCSSAIDLCARCVDGYEVRDGGKSCGKTPPVRCSSAHTCSSGSYCETSTNYCVRCHPDCTECIGPSFDHCIKCKNNQLVDPRTRQCPSCKSGQYFDAEQNNCFACGANCQICSKVTNCVQCMPGYGVEAGRCLSCCKAGEEKKYTCASCPQQLSTSPDSAFGVKKVVVLLCIAGVAFFFVIFGLLMWKDRHYEHDAKKYAYSKVPMLYDIGNETQLVVDADDEKRYENGGVDVPSDEEDFDTGGDAGDEDTLFDQKLVKNGR